MSAKITVDQMQTIREAMEILRGVTVRTPYSGEVHPRAFNIDIVTEKQARTLEKTDGAIRLRSKKYPFTTLYFIDLTIVLNEEGS